MKKEKRCPRCGETKSISDWYYSPTTKKFKPYCKLCVSKIAHMMYMDEKVMKYPNQYVSENQKKEVFQVMENLGWIFIEDTCRWYKPGVKDENGVWCNKIKAAEI